MAMTAFDLAVLAVIGLSAMLGLWRGVIREVFALSAWIAALILAWMYGEPAAQLLPQLAGPVWLRQLTGYCLVFLAVFVTLSVIGHLFAQLTRAIGLGYVDRSLGLMFGVLRGGLVVALLVLLAGATTLPNTSWWRQSVSAAPFEMIAALLRARLPDDLARHLRATTYASASIQRS